MCVSVCVCAAANHLVTHRTVHIALTLSHFHLIPIKIEVFMSMTIFYIGAHSTQIGPAELMTDSECSFVIDLCNVQLTRIRTS